MSITISVSKRVEQKIRRRAKTTGRKPDEIVSDLVEEVWDKTFPDDKETDVEQEYENPFTLFTAMGSSGKTDTSERYKEILRQEIDEVGGFGGR